MTTDTLPDSLTRSWSCLEAGAAPGKSRFSMVQVASIGLDGAPRARTVVIRNADPAERRIAFHTDLRSPKVAELQADPRVAVIGYDMEAGLQVRLSGAARLHNQDSDALAAWAETRSQSRRPYHGAHAPGDVLTDPVAGETPSAGSDPAHDAPGYHRFCLVIVTIAEIDWLDLAASGHRRARHRWTGDGWDSVWLAP